MSFLGQDWLDPLSRKLLLFVAFQNVTDFEVRCLSVLCFRSSAYKLIIIGGSSLGDTEHFHSLEFMFNIDSNHNS